jgi:HAD superfamily hydrolase (TIGR01509 family)
LKAWIITQALELTTKMWRFITFFLFFSIERAVTGFRVCHTSANQRSQLRHSKLSMLASSGNAAILFDCDGVIVEAEDLQRAAYNSAFKHFGLVLQGKPVNFDEDTYSKLLGGGKSKLNNYFAQEKRAWPVLTRPYRAAPKTAADQNSLLELLEEQKNIFLEMIIAENAKAQPGVLKLMDSCFSDPTIKIGLCSGSSRDGFDAVIGKPRVSQMDVVVTGDEVRDRKPSPQLYTVAAQKLGVSPDRCVVVADSSVALKAAKAANMRVVVAASPKNGFSGSGADKVVQDFSSMSVADVKALLPPASAPSSSSSSSSGGLSFAGSSSSGRESSSRAPYTPARVQSSAPVVRQQENREEASYTPTTVSSSGGRSRGPKEIIIEIRVKL